MAARTHQSEALCQRPARVEREGEPPDMVEALTPPLYRPDNQLRPQPHRLYPVPLPHDALLQQRWAQRPARVRKMPPGKGQPMV